MRGITRILPGLTLAAGMFGGSAAMAMGDGYHYRSSTTYYFTEPSTTYYYTEPSTTFYYRSPSTTYSYIPHSTYAPSGTFGYYDNVYDPYWAYSGPLGQGSGHDMRIGR